MEEAQAYGIISKFNQCIGHRDIEGLAALMTTGHVFIDAASNTIAGKERCIEAWSGFFAAFPDYRNVFEQVTLRGDEAVIAGYSLCADSRLAGPALWTAKLEGAFISEWRVYEDTPANRLLLKLPE